MAKMRLGFTPEVRASLMRQAHDECRRKVPVELHVTKGGRRRIARPRDKYLACIGEFIRARIIEEYKKRGVPVSGF